MAKVLADLVYAESFERECGHHIRQLLTDELKKSSPYRDAMTVAEVLDAGSGQLNLSGLDMLTKGVEGDANGKVQYGGGYFTTRYYILQAQAKVNAAAQLEIPFKPIESAELDGVEFEFQELLIFILKLFGLYEIAKDPTQARVQICITLDGADISRNISHVTCRIKIIDPRAIDPMSKLPIGLDGSRKVQSRELCIPFKIVLTRDTKALYTEEFKEFFDYFADVAANGLPAEGIQPLEVSSPQDMSSFWKCLKRGGGCKVKDTSATAVLAHRMKWRCPARFVVRLVLRRAKPSAIIGQLVIQWHWIVVETTWSI